MTTRKVYWAGALFNVKELVGNRMLADAFDRKADGRWEALLPQESESENTRPDAIRDNDLELLFSSDAIVANFDGNELDSGTVVEFCFAKFLDLPAVILRTDFRGTSVEYEGGEPWNLMCSGYPRTEVLLYNPMNELRHMDFHTMLDNLGERIVQTLEHCTSRPTIFADKEAAYAAFEHALKVAGGSMPQRFTENRIREIIEKRHLKDEKSLSYNTYIQ